MILGDNAPDPGEILDPHKVKGYSVQVKYLTGDDTVCQSWGSPSHFYSTQGLEIHLIHKSHKYIFIYFIPSTMFTFTSWVSYLIPPTAYPARHCFKVLGTNGEQDGPSLVRVKVLFECDLKTLEFPQILYDP